MSLFTPGAGGDLKSVTLPAAILELATKVQLAEQSSATPVDNVQISTNSEGTLVSISMNIPVVQSVDPINGFIRTVATDYLV